MSSTQTSTTVTSASFLNLFGVLVSVVLCTMFLILGGHTLKYIKAFAVKIKIISNRAKDKNVQIKDFNYTALSGSEKSEAFQKVEQVFKNEIKKSRSLQLPIIFANLLAKYDHLLYYPFRDRISDQYNLLKPKTTFYTLLVVCTACIAWMITIFLSAILQNVYSDVTTVPLGVFIGMTVVIAVLSSILNMITTNRLFRVYLLNMKAAFKVHYGNEFVSAHQNLKEYEPLNEIEQEELLRGGKNLTRVGGDQEESEKFTNIFKQSQVESQTQRSIKEETLINSTRKLLGDEFDKSDKNRLLQSQNSQHEQTVIEEQKYEDEAEDGPHVDIVQYNKEKKSKALKDLFDLQVGIEGHENADPNSKYIFIEDTAAIGDVDLLNNEAGKGENKSNVTTFIVLFVIVAGASMVCCYLNYSFSKALAQYVFYMFVGGFLGDLIVSRPFFVFLLALFTYCKGAAKGYKKVPFKNSKDIKDLMGKAIKDMLNQRKKAREDSQKQISSGDHTNLIPAKSHQNLSQEDMMNLQDYMTQNAYERDESKAYGNFAGIEDNKEDEIAMAIDEKRDNDGDGQKNPIFNLQKAFKPTDFARPKIEDKQFPEQVEEKVNFASTGIPLISKLKQAIQESEDSKYADIMQKKHLGNDLVDYNLLLLRKIYDAYEEKAEKVIKNFRSDNHGVLRKRYMVPIINPNYDYDKFLKELQDKGLVNAKDEEEENSVHLDGMTVCDEQDKQVMDAIMQEAEDDLVPKNVNRRRIDRFGNPIDEDKEFIKTTLLPAYGQIEHKIEENLAEDDEDARRRWLLEQYWRREDDGESFNKEETTERDELESWRLNQLEENISNLSQTDYNSLSDNDKLNLLSDKRQKVDILLRQLRRKKNLTKEEQELMKQLERQALELEYQHLQLKDKLGTITDDERNRLHELERMFDFEEIDALRNKWLSAPMDQEYIDRLRFLEDKWGLEHMKDPWYKEPVVEQVEDENHDEEDLFQEEEPQFMEEDSRHSGITEDENFAELPPVHVMNNTSKPQSPSKAEEQKRLEMEEKMRQELLEKERLEQLEREKQELLEKERLDQLEKERLEREEQERLSELERQRLLQEEELRKQQELDAKMLEEQNRLRDQQEEIENRRRLEEEEMNRLQEEQKRLHDQQLEQMQQQRDLEEQQRLNQEAKFATDLEKLENEEDELRSRIEELLEKQRNGTLTEEELEELRRLQERLEDLQNEKETLMSHRSDELQRQKEEEEKRRQQEEELLKQQELLQKQIEDQEAERQQQLLEEQEALQRQQQELEDKRRQLELDEQERLRKIQELEDLQEQEKLRTQSELERLKSAEADRLRKQQELDELERLERLKQQERDQQEASFNQIENSAIENDRSRSSEEGMEAMSRIGSRKQDRLNQQMLNNLEDEDVMRNTDYAFGHDDLEPKGENESIYSHKTTTILDEEKVSFMHIEQLPNQDNASDNSFSEQDMVYYNKDDLTNYSKGLGLNKIKAKNPAQQNYFSENDLQEVEEGEGDLSENDSRRSGMSHDHAGRRNQYGRGKINHNNFEIQDQSEYFEGRVKVDAWNLNYKKKKKKLKKKKQVTDAQKRKMNDLQNIYGIDAKTLAGLSKGRMPRQLLASGKFNKDGMPDDTRHSDMSFRSTQNTFMKPHQSTAAKSGLRQSVNDAQSNMFSFNGYGTSKRWNEIESTLKGGPKDSRMDFNGSQLDQRGKFPGSKMTQTQENFARLQGKGRNQVSPSDMLEEESKSGHSGSRSRGGSMNARQFGSSNKKGGNKGQFGNGKKGQKNGASGAKGNKSKKNRRGSSDGVDSHTESDEAVDDKGALFQKRNGPWNMGGRSNGFGSMNDDYNDHSESDEANNQENPDFGGNQFAFKKREFDDQAANSKLKKGVDQAWSHQDAKNQRGKNGAKGSFKDSFNNGVEDLEAQNFSNRKGRGTNKKGGIQDDEGLNASTKFARGPKNAFNSQSDGFRGGSAEREDSEDENLGGEVNFQKQNNRGDYLHPDQEGRYLDVSGHKRNGSNNNLNKSSSKPPLSGRKQRDGRSREGRSRGGDGLDSSHLYAEPYNINGVIHPGVSENVRMMNAGYGQSDQSDNEGRMRSTFNQSDLGLHGGNKHGGQSSNRPGGNNGAGQNFGGAGAHDRSHLGGHPSGHRGGNGGSSHGGQYEGKFDGKVATHVPNLHHMWNSHSDSNLLNPNQHRQGKGPSSKQGGQGRREGSQGRRDGSQGSGRGSGYGRRQGSQGSYEEEADYIVGPESMNTKIKKRPRQAHGQGNDEDDERYMLLQRERQIIEDIETERNLEGDTSKLAKKRKIKRAAHSQNPKDAQAQKFRELQQEKLRKKQREAEAALFASNDEDDLEKGQAKLKKKKVKKEWVKKEVNYWLDYDSPYAEYLVARFREWSPNPNIRSGSAGSGHKVKGVSNKYQEVSNVYNKHESKQNSRSRERRFGPAAEGGSSLNLTNQNKNLLNSNSKQKHQAMIVDDFEEP